MSDPASRFRARVDYTKTLDCIHCGLCIESCPTYRLTGQENASPRGRIHAMRAVAEERLPTAPSFAHDMQFCLLCRQCESVCPSGVHFGPLMESAREALEAARPGPLPRRLLRWLGFRILLPSRLALSLAGFSLAIGQQSGLMALLKRILGARGGFLDSAAPLPAASERRRLARDHAPSPLPGIRAPEQPELWFLEGCVMPLWLGRVNRAALSSLTALGHRVRLPNGVVCCGSLHAHNGDREGSRTLAKRLIESLEGDASDGPLIVPSAGCSAHLKELPQLFDPADAWHARAAGISARTRDYAEFIAGALSRSEARLAPKVPALRVAWDDPCHLCHGQQVREEPRQALDLLPGIQRVDLEDSESCCGSAGIYSMLEPKASAEIFAPKAVAFRRSAASALVTANPGCQLQFQTGFARHGIQAPVLHLAELVAQALAGTDSAPPSLEAPRR